MMLSTLLSDVTSDIMTFADMKTDEKKSNLEKRCKLKLYLCLVLDKRCDINIYYFLSLSLF